MSRNRRGWGHVKRQRSGRWQASYIGRDLVRHYAPVTFTHRMDAEGWLYTERKLYENHAEWQPPKVREAQKIAAAIPFADYAQTWLQQRTLKPRTAKMYADLLRLHLNPVLGLVPVDKLTPQAVRGWHSQMDSDKPRVRSHAYGLLHAIAGHARERWLFASESVSHRAGHADHATANHRHPDDC